MDISGPFYFHGRSYSKGEFLRFAKEQVSTGEVEYWEKAVLDFVLDFFNEEMLLVQNTSGTTGEPKQVVLKREGMLISAQKTIDYFGLKEKDKVLLCLPLNYIAGKMMVVRALLGGLDLHVVEPTGNPLSAIGEEFMFAALVPMQLYSFLEEGRTNFSVRKILLGGGVVSAELREMTHKFLDVEIYESFGMTETLSHIGLRRYNQDYLNAPFSILPGVDVSLDKRGCLVINAEGITDGDLVTNDMGELVGENAFRWLGRYDNLIKSGGIQIIPEVLEQSVDEICVLPCLFVGLPDAKLGEKLVMVLEGVKNEELTQFILEQIGRELKTYEIPKEVHYLKEFPRNEAGKVRRRSVVEIVLKNRISESQ